MMTLESAAALVAECRKNIADIRSAISKREEIVADSDRRRQPHTLQAALGHVAAKDALAKILHEDLAAERTLADLRKVLRQSEAELLAAENAQRAAEVESRKAEVNRLARQRCAAAEKIDAALSAFSSSWAEYESIGRELFNASVDRQDQIYLAEHFDGLLRLASSLPHEPFYSIRWKHSFAAIGTSSSLAILERQFWRLPAPEEAKAA
jgi:hypothetical protein